MKIIIKELLHGLIARTSKFVGFVTLTEGCINSPQYYVT